MSYRIEKHEALSDALGRIAGEEIALAMEALRRPNRAEAMHGTRKALKRLRSLLRSLRVALPGALFRQENRRLARAGRKIAPLRDLHVQLRALGRLRAGPGSAATKIHRNLLRRQRRDTRKIPALRRAVRQMLSVSRETIASWRLDHATPADLAAGVTRIYRRARDAARKARKKPTPEGLHEWRKQAKILGYGLELMERLGPKKARAMIRDVGELSEALGEDHDLFLVLEALRREDAAQPSGDYRRLERRICAKRRKRQRQSFKLGKNIFAVKPRDFQKTLDRLAGGNPLKK